jgi:isovaleryl-CoA dehydrogenase
MRRFPVTNLCANNIYRNAGEELRRRYLPGLCAGKLIGASA